MGLAAMVFAALLACSDADGPVAAGDEGPRPELGLMGTIPIYWGESAGLGEMLNGQADSHWARAELERSFRLAPLDVLDETSLASLDYLLLAQPRALLPEENVALDAWARAGGRLLLFADPMMTGHSRYGLGDRRRPQDVILLSPLLTHWGLELQFVEDQSAGVQTREIAGMGVPVDLPGQFVIAGHSRACTLDAGGVLARCRLGDGMAVIWADAAVIDLENHAPEPARALHALVQEAFEVGEDAGREATARQEHDDSSKLPTRMNADTARDHM